MPGDAITQLDQELRRRGAAEGGTLWYGKPDRWYDETRWRWRCPRGHVCATT